MVEEEDYEYVQVYFETWKQIVKLQNQNRHDNRLLWSQTSSFGWGDNLPKMLPILDLFSLLSKEERSVLGPLHT